jgi:hypothetical protein
MTAIGRFPARVVSVRRPEVWVCLVGFSSAVLYVVVRSTARGAWNGGRPTTDQASTAFLAAAYALGLTLLFGLYVLLLKRTHLGLLATRRSRILVLAVPVLVQIAMLVDTPVLSTDLFTYLALGYIGTLPGGNPYLQQARSIGDTPFGQQLVALGWPPAQGPSPYGPLWNELATAIVAVTQNAHAALLLTKIILVAASLGSAGLIWLALSRVDPAMRLLGTVAYLWNPLVIVEIAGEGHNDAILALTVLAALAASVYMRPGITLVALTVGTLSKYVPLMLLPAQLVYFWRAGGARPGRFWLPLALGIIAALLVFVGAFLPMWAGTATFQSAIRVALSNPASSPEQLSPRILGVLRLIAFGLFTLIASWRVRDATSLLTTCGAIALMYAAVGSASYWQWYDILPVALLSLSPRRFLSIVVVLSGLAELQAPALLFVRDGLTTDEIITWTSRAARGIPVVVYVLVVLAERYRLSWSVNGERAGAVLLRRSAN